MEQKDTTMHPNDFDIETYLLLNGDHVLSDELKTFYPSMGLLYIKASGLLFGAATVDCYRGALRNY